MMSKGFIYKNLEINLKVGRGANVKLPNDISLITVQFGKDDALPALQAFYVNELPRLYYSNPHLKFNTVQGDRSFLQIESKNKKMTVDLFESRKPEDIFNLFMTKLNIK